MMCANSPVALGRHRSCPDHPNGSGHISIKPPLSPKSVAGPRDNMMCANSPIALGLHRSCPEQTNDGIHISIKPWLSPKNVAGHIIFGSVLKNHGLNDIPEPRALFYDMRDEEWTLRGNMTPIEKKTSSPGTEAVAPVGEEECTAQATVTDDNADTNKEAEPTKNEKGQETLITLGKRGFISSLIGDCSCSTHDSSISTDDSSIFSSILTEELQMQKKQESLKEVGVEVLHALSQSISMSSDAIVKNSPSFDGSGVHIIYDTTSDDLRSEYDLSRSVMIVETHTATSLLNEMSDMQDNSHHGEYSARTVQVANTIQHQAERQKSLQSALDDVKSMESQRAAELRIFYDTVADAEAEAETLASEESYDSCNLQHAFRVVQVLTSYVTNKVNFSKKLRESTADDEAMDKMVFM